MEAAYETFGCNTGNVFFLGIDKGSTNNNVIYFDSIYGVEYPEVSGVQGNGNQIHLMYDIISTPSIVVIRPDHVIAVKQIWPPSFTNVTDSVSEAGGIFQECLTATEIKRQKKHLVVAPNPVSDFAYFTFDLNEPETIEVTIRSITGQVVFHNKPTAFAAGKALIEANLSLQSKGFYVAEVRENGQFTRAEKIIVSH